MFNQQMPQLQATRRPDAGHAELGGGISRGLVLLLATACGTAAANLYYAQPLLHTLARAFGVSNGTAGLLITISQLGYVVGLALLVPLGDLHERRGLISGHDARDRRRAGAGGRGPGVRGAGCRAGGGGRDLGGGPDRRPDELVAGGRARARVGGGHGDERPADRDPAGPHRERPDRRGVRLARGLLVRRGRDGDAGRDPAPRAAARPADHRSVLRRAAALGGGARPRGARPAPAHDGGRAHLRLLQHAVDVAGLPALRGRLTTTATA